MSRIGIIFDLDGTLIDSITVTKNAFNAARDSYGNDNLATAEDFISLSGAPLQSVCDQLSLPGSFAENYLSHSARLRSTIQPFPGVVDILNILRGNNTPIAILTGKDRGSTGEILNNLSIDSFFEIVVTPDDDHRSKPHPDAAIWISGKLNVKPEFCIMVGDSTIDITCGRNSGMKTIGCTWGVAKRRLLSEAGAHQIVDSISELKDFMVNPNMMFC